MKPCTRWLDDPALAADLRADLECAREHAWQPDFARAALQLDQSLAAEPTPSLCERTDQSAALSTASGAVPGAASLKLALAAISCSVLVAAGVWQLRGAPEHDRPVPPALRATARRVEPQPPTVATAVADGSATELASAPKQDASRSEEAAAVTPHAAAVPVNSAPDLVQQATPLERGSRSSDSSTLRREIEQLQRIYATLERDPAEAYRLARISLREIPHGALREEREGLAVIALCQNRRADRATARRSAERFLASYPHSPLREKVRALLGAEQTP